MGVFDSIKKIVSGDIAHDAADSGNPIKIGGRAKTSIPVAVADGDRVNAYFDKYGRLYTMPSALHVSDDVDQVTADTSGELRMTQYRELIVSPNMLRGQYFSNSAVASPTDITVSATNWYSGYGAPSTAFFDGSDGGFGAGERYIKIPMFRFARGATIGLYNALAVSLTVQLRAVITSNGSSNGVNGMIIFDGSVANANLIFFSPLPLADTANADWNYVPQMAIPMEALIVEITPASDPSSGYFLLTVTR